MEIKEILVPTDFSEDSLKAVPYASLLAKRFGAKVYLLHVLDDLKGIAGFYVPHISTEILEEEMEKEARRMLTTFRKRYLKGLNDVEETLLKGAPEEEIVRFAQEKGVDVIVMASHGRTGMDRILLGSTVERVLKKASCPIFLVPSKGE